MTLQGARVPLATITNMTRWTGKVVGGLLGMLTLGPVGAALGFLFGHQFDTHGGDVGSKAFSPGSAAEIGERFFRAAFRVMGHVAKSDGRVSQREIDAARGIMTELRLDASRVQAAIGCFNEGKQPAFDLAAELANLRRVCADRPDLLRIFLEIQVRAALAGNNIEGTARVLLTRVATKLGVSLIELAQIEAVLRIRRGSFAQDAARSGAAPLVEAYKVLEVASTVSNEEVVKAYRRQLSRHHPDKLKANGLPESMLEHAKERTQEIIEAYELIRERRGINS
jgi:DnaJ like chaperone protein